MKFGAFVSFNRDDIRVFRTALATVGLVLDQSRLTDDQRKRVRSVISAVCDNYRSVSYEHCRWFEEILTLLHTALDLNEHDLKQEKEKLAPRREARDGNAALPKPSAAPMVVDAAKQLDAIANLRPRQKDDVMRAWKLVTRAISRMDLIRNMAADLDKAVKAEIAQLYDDDESDIEEDDGEDKEPPGFRKQPPSVFKAPKEK